MAASAPQSPDIRRPRASRPTRMLTNPARWSRSRTGNLYLNGAEVTYAFYDGHDKPVGSGLSQSSSTPATAHNAADPNETFTAKPVRVGAEHPQLRNIALPFTNLSPGQRNAHTCQGFPPPARRGGPAPPRPPRGALR